MYTHPAQKRHEPTTGVCRWLEENNVPGGADPSWKGDMKLPLLPIWFASVDTCWNVQFRSLVISVFKPRYWKSAGLVSVWRDYDVDREQ
jgi:hypothetical protein